MAALFLILGLYCLHWLDSRGAFGAAPVERPIRLESGSSATVHFSVPHWGDRDIEIWYPRNASSDVSKDVCHIVGKMTLQTDRSLVRQEALPVDHSRSDRDGAAMVISTGPMAPGNDYSLLLEIDRMPPDLARSQAVVKAELAPDYYYVFFQLEVMSVLLFTASLFCAFLSLRWWRAVTRARADGVSL